MIEKALILIALCEVARVFQNMVQLRYTGRAEKAQIDAYGEFVKSLNKDDRETVKGWLEALEDACKEDTKKCSCNCNKSH